MRDERQAELVGRLRHPDPHVRGSHAARSMRNPAAHYVDPRRFTDERQALFRQRPQFVGLSIDCAIPGSTLTRDCGGIRIRISRESDGNLCAFAGADRDPIECAVAEQHGLIYVHPTSRATFVVDYLLQGMQTEFVHYGIPTAHPIETRVSTWKMNWKLLLDVFLEPYHIQFLHRKTIDPIFLSNQLYDSFGSSPRVIGMRRGIMPQLETQPADAWRLFPNAAAVYLLMPNALLTYQGDHLEIWRVEPIDALTTRAFTTLYAPEPPTSRSALDYWLRNLEILCDVTFREDFPIQMQIQANLLSGVVDEVVYGRNEPGLIDFHSTVNSLTLALD